MAGVGFFSLGFFAAASSSQATIMPVTPRIAMETEYHPMDVLTRIETETLRRVEQQTQIQILPSPIDPYISDDICSKCSTKCYQCSGMRFHIACSSCRNVCPPRRFRLNHGSRLTGLTDGGFWMEGVLTHPSGRRYLHVAGHHLTQNDGNIHNEFWNKCVQARISDNIDKETSRIYEENRTVASDSRKVAFILGLIQQSQTAND